MVVGFFLILLVHFNSYLDYMKDYNCMNSFFFFFLLAMPVPCGSSWAGIKSEPSSDNADSLTFHHQGTLIMIGTLKVLHKSFKNHCFGGIDGISGASGHRFNPQLGTVG